MQNLYLLLKEKIYSFTPGYLQELTFNLLIAALVITVAYAVFLFTKKVVVRALIYLVKRTKTSLDDILLDKKIISYIPHLGMNLFVFLFFENTFFKEEFPVLFFTLKKVIIIYMSLISLFIVSRLLRNILAFYESLKLPDNFNLKGIYQAINVFLHVFTTIIIIATILGETPWKILSGLGALTAVLLFVFKEPILGFVSGIQIFANKMAKVGDWVEMPEHNVDGNIIDISLTTVKIRNWDKTIILLPSHRLTSESFKNWEGMVKSGGRRIKRSLFIDMKTVRFLNETELNKLKKNLVFKDYFLKKEKIVSNFEIDINRQVIKEKGQAKKKVFPTTVGVFREYTVHYLKNHPLIHQKFTLMVRALSPEPKGLPVEIYCFTKTTDWIEYEKIQSEIFEHLISVAKGFYLKIFQDPTGSDFGSLK